MLEKIISGGQTGADRAALDFAISRNIPHGGWCPKGRLAEDGRIDLKYRLKETPSSGYFQRVKWNIRDSDGTVIFTIGKNLSGGSELTSMVAKALESPCLHLSSKKNDPSSALKKFILDHKIRILNVAGSRSSKEPDITRFTLSTLEKILENIPISLCRTMGSS